MALLDLAQIKTPYASQLVGGDMRRTFSGAKLTNLGSNQSIVGLGKASVNFGAVVEDFGGWHDVGTPNVLTVPDGITRVRAYLSIQFFGTFGGSDDLMWQLTIGGTSFFDAGSMGYNAQAGIFLTYSMGTPPFDVTPGDDIGAEVDITVLTPASITVVGTRDSYLAVEAV